MYTCSMRIGDNMKKNAFTLIELLSVIAILGIIAVIAVPSLIGELKNSKNNAFDTVKKIIISSAKNYVIDNNVALPESISINLLCDDNYLTCPVLDPTDNTEVNGYVNISRNKTYEYSATPYSFVKLTINLEGGTTTQKIVNKGIPGERITLTNPTKAGYGFRGFNVSGAGSSINNGVLTIGSADTTLTATWEMNAVTLTIDLGDGGSISPDPSGPYNVGTTVTIPNPTRLNYIFGGWTGGTVVNNELVMNENTTLTAIWVEKYVQTYSYDGQYKTWKVPRDGTYKIELWGASGSNPQGTSGGAYTRGYIELTKDTELYFYVGEGLNTTANGVSFNGGTGSGGAFGGGGATDVRIVHTTGLTIWNEKESLVSRIMIAAGSGSRSVAGGAGGLQGYSGSQGVGGTQTAGGNGYAPVGGFGYGGGGYGGGGGYYGGGGASYTATSGGGSSYISGHKGCVALASSSTSSIVPRTGTGGAACVMGTADSLCSEHYSGMVFTDTLMIDGAGYTWTNEKSATVGTNLMPNPNGGDDYASGISNVGNGYARITLESIS